MADMIIPLLDQSNPANIKRYKEFCKIFFKEYDKDNDNYISKEELKVPLNEILDHFSSQNMGYLKLKILFKLLEEDNDQKMKNELEELIDQLNVDNIDDNITDIVELLDKNGNNKISFNEFTEVVRLLLYCLIDYSTTDKPSSPKSLELDLFTCNDDNLECEEFVHLLVDDILKDFDNMVNLTKLKGSIVRVLSNVSIDDKILNIEMKDIDIIYKLHNIDNITELPKKKIEQVLYIIINNLLQ